MIEHFDLEGLGSYALEPVSETTRVVNPAARALSAQIKSKAMQLTRRRAEYGRKSRAPKPIKSGKLNCETPFKPWNKN